MTSPGWNQPQDGIRLSVILRIVGGGEFLRRCLSALSAQVEGLPVEVIVPCDSTVPGIQAIKEKFTWARYIDLEDQASEKSQTPGKAHELYDLRTAAGLRASRGELLALLEDYGIPSPDWCQKLINAHCLPYAVIGGAVEQKGSDVLNWAVYFLDFGRYQLPFQTGPAEYLTDVNISYKRYSLGSVIELWWESYNEVIVNWGLAKKREILWRLPEMVVFQDRGKLRLRDQIFERFYWGRLFAEKRASQISRIKCLLLILSSPLLPCVILYRLTKGIIQKKRHTLHFIKAFPYMVILALFWSAGEFLGNFRDSGIRFHI